MGLCRGQLLGLRGDRVLSKYVLHFVSFDTYPVVQRHVHFVLSFLGDHVTHSSMSHFRNKPVAPGIAFITGGARGKFQHLFFQVITLFDFVDPGLGNAIAVSFAKEGARGVALVDIQNETTFNEGKANVEKYGAKVEPRQN